MKQRVLAVAVATMSILITGAVAMHAQDHITPANGLFNGNPAAVLNVVVPSGYLDSSGTCPPLTFGYWKNHQSAWQDGTGLTLGNNFYTNAQLETLLETPVRGDASVDLAHQLIGALLNIANGTTSAPIQATITDANNLIGSGTIPEGISPSSPVGQQMESDASILNDYNNGKITNACGHIGPS